MESRDYLQSPRLLEAGFTHAFFTRRGGVSSGPFASLNLSPDVGDDPDHVRENSSRAAAVLGVGADRLYMTRQVHGADVLVIDGSEALSAVAARAADASISDAPGLACAVRTADCVPILIGDRESGRVAAVHAGWRGVAANIAGACVRQLSELGSDPRALIAALGPHITAPAFEVGEDVALALERAPGGAGSVIRRSGRKPHVDLAHIVREQLLLAGLDASHVDSVPGCTVADAASFFSHRRDGAASGRLLSAIVPRGSGARRFDAASRMLSASSSS